jgi:RNA polymerase sigma-70 factor (ECF subfamily)
MSGEGKPGAHGSGGGDSRFPVTRWSLVLRAHDDDVAAARQAMEELFRAYWYPLYCHARRRGLDMHDAEDATQAFCLKLLERDSLRAADRGRGRLRSFLLGAMSHFLTQQWRNQNTLKRGAGVTVLSIDVAEAEQRLAANPHGDGPAEADFDRDWAYALIDRVFGRLRDFHASRSRLEVFESLKGCLLDDGAYDAGRAAELGLTPAGLRSAVYQMRQRFRRYIEEEIRDTVGEDADVREELGYLCRVLAEHRG